MLCRYIVRAVIIYVTGAIAGLPTLTDFLSAFTLSQGIFVDLAFDISRIYEYLQ